MSDDEQPTALPFKLTPIDPAAPDTRDYAEIEAELKAMRSQHQPLIDEYAKLEAQARAADVSLIEPRRLCPTCKRGDFTSRHPEAMKAQSAIIAANILPPTSRIVGVFSS